MIYVPPLSVPILNVNKAVAVADGWWWRVLSVLQPGQLQPDWSDKVTVACSVPPPLASPHVTGLDQSYPCQAYRY